MVMTTSTAAHPDNSPSEMVELVDAAGNVLGLVTRAQMRAESLWHRSVFIAVVSHAGQLLVHKRADTKDVWPGSWDVCVGGVMAPGEDWEHGALRELREELGLEGVSVESLGTGVYVDDDVRIVAACFVCRTDGPFVFADGEITEAHWAPPEEIPVWLGAKHFLPDSIALVLPRLQLS
jgi:isopentenyldiphosphate isomerase